MTLKEAAALLGVTPDNLRGAIARGSMKAKKLGRDWFVDSKEVERYRSENRRLLTSHTHRMRDGACVCGYLAWHRGPHGHCKTKGEHVHG